MNRDPFRRAISYPYEIPAHSFVIDGNRHAALETGPGGPDVSGRRPVLAVGSNQAPEQLLRKFRDADLGPIPVIRATLKDFDIVYSPHVSAYGSIPATLRHSPGTRATLFVNWLTPAQEARMHRTETASGNYEFGRLDGIELDPETGPAMTAVFVYSSRRGSLTRSGVPVSLAAVEAENRRWPGLNQEQVQTFARDLLAPHLSLEAFVMAAIEDSAIRRARTEALMADSAPFNYPGFRPIEV